jgi:two-component system cell cycle response regulator
MRVLVAEDDPISRRRMEKRLGEWGYETVLARDGDEAWAILSSPDAPQLAILDWMMPGLDGPEICRRIRSESRDDYVYVVLLTTKSLREDLLLGLEAGADDYLTKPFDAQELNARLRIGRRIVDLQLELRHRATRDPLTGAWNRAAALTTLEREVARASRTASDLAVLLADIDHFKKINDLFGHLAGDQALCETVRRIQAVVRPYDVLGRYGGEEFLLVLPECAADHALAVAERVRAEMVREPVQIEGRRIDVTCSLGVATTNGETTPERLIGRADTALYRAKNGGRNRVELFCDPDAMPASRLVRTGTMAPASLDAAAPDHVGLRGILLNAAQQRGHRHSG